jgi:hypothetical protein
MRGARRGIGEDGGGGGTGGEGGGNGIKRVKDAILN